MSTRRSFVVNLAAAAAYLASPRRLFAQSAARLGIPAFSPAALGASQQGNLNLARFQALIGSSFRAFLDDNEVVDIVLIKVSTMDAINAAEQATLPAANRSKVKSAGRPPAPQSAGLTFVVQFSSGNKYIPQDTYVLDNGTLGSFSVLLVPGAINAPAKTCSALFNGPAASPLAAS